MTNLDVSNSSTDSSSGSSSDSSSSGSSSTSSGSGSSSSDSESSTSDTPAVAQPAPKSPAKPDEEPPKKKDDSKPRQTTNKKVSSSSDDDVPKPEPPKPAPPRRRSSTKPKSAASVLAKGKPPRAAAGAKTPKPIPKTMTKQQTKNDQKKKSIFSPDNSSESESESKSSKSPKGSPKNKRGTRKSSEDKDTSPPSPLTAAENDDSNSKDNIKRRSGSRPSGPPSKKVVDNKSASSCSSSQSSAETVSSESDSEPTPKKEPIKTGKTKPPSSANKVEKGKSDSGESQANNMPRKLTRSLSARVSRMATATRPRTTDTDSDVDEKPNDKSKEIKKKGRPLISRSPIAELTPPQPSERRCPVRGCDSTGHLGGKAGRHFTWDACPLYHNVTGAWCVAAAEERAAAAAARRRALANMQQRPRAMPTIEQRAYQLKVKDMRSKWKGSQELREKLAASGGDDMNEEREPILEGFAPDYDLRLFREAQALAAIKIEEELGDIPTDKGTRFVVMGKYMMEVWYQSPYPNDAARVPRLFVCEFCLNHHKSATGAERHRAKCVWRHPPGDEVYRKDKLSVWQVDGRKHKQYCQQLCLLAKFFLDHKTLYYDVEPFLFYVMTCADEEGCHVVGYFSKEKNSFLNYNVSCILTLPPYQRQGYGRLLIDFSYLLTKVEGKVGSPETPLSDLGLISYRSYWKEALLKRLCSAPGPTLCIRDLSKDLAIASSDIVSTLQERGLMKYWKGKHIVLKKQDVLEELSRRADRARCVEPSCLRWTPPGAPPPR
ncbi:histone acetyltransferase KAT7 [Cydia splendana]|uniref:histone acetyltransferase KAT7 n=1 Tax=Cydia splendana TaxID=1100963 RepID=UPI00212D5438